MDINLISAAGSRSFYTSVGNALKSDATFTELLYMEILTGGDIKNIFRSYLPFNSNTPVKKIVGAEYGNITVQTAKIISDNPEAFETSAARILNDLANTKTSIDLIKCVPVINNIYECTIYSGFFDNSNLDSIKSNELLMGVYNFQVFGYKEAIGTIESGSLVLAERTM